MHEPVALIETAAIIDRIVECEAKIVAMGGRKIPKQVTDTFVWVHQPIQDQETSDPVALDDCMIIPTVECECEIIPYDTSIILSVLFDWVMDICSDLRMLDRTWEFKMPTPNGHGGWSWTVQYSAEFDHSEFGRLYKDGTNPSKALAFTAMLEAISKGAN